MAPTVTQKKTKHQQVILHDNTTGRLIYDTFLSLAKKMWAAGKEATGDFAAANFPDCKLVKNEYANRTFRRTIKTTDGEHALIIYDYIAKTISAALLVQSPVNDEYIAGKRNGISTDRLDLYYYTVTA
jgi:hypothetical protein